MKSPKISVCIPSYNCDKFIKEAMDSVFAQSFGDFELIVVDDHSTDKTIDIVNQFRDPRLRVIRNTTNVGAERNWNMALSEAQGEYIKILCDDDLLHPECLKMQLGILEKESNRDVVLASCMRYIIEENGKVIMKRGFKQEGKINGLRAIRRTITAGINLIGEPSSVLIRKKALQSVGGFDGSFPYVIDLDFWLRLLVVGNMYALVEPLCYFRVSSSSWSHALRKKQCRDFKRFIDKIGHDSRYGLTGVDCAIGKCAVVVNSFARNLFYKIFL